MTIDDEHTWKNNCPKLWEFYQATDREHPENYFNPPQKPKPADRHAWAYLDEWNRLLESMDETAFKAFIARTKPYVVARDPKRDWSQLIDCINEARAYYNLRVESGFQDVQFVDEEPNKETPDLIARSNGELLCIEVKTIHKSEVALAAFGTLQQGLDGIPLGLEEKIRVDFQKAQRQMASYLDEKKAKKIIFFFIALDLSTDLVGDNKERLEELFRSLESPECEIRPVLHS